MLDKQTQQRKAFPWLCMCRVSVLRGTFSHLLRPLRCFSSSSCASFGSLMSFAQARGETVCQACGSDHSQVLAALLPWRSSTAWPLQCPSSWKTPEKRYVSGADRSSGTDTIQNTSSHPPDGGKPQAGCLLCVSVPLWGQNHRMLGVVRDLERSSN